MTKKQFILAFRSDRVVIVDLADGNYLELGIAVVTYP